MADSDLIPVNVITGFLGSGKTTLLRHLLASPDFADCAVLINEFGEIGIDHHLVERVDGDLVLLRSGCICCTIRGDLSDTIRALWSRRERGEVAPFRRVAIETTGLADPTPILATIMSERVIRHHFRLGNVVTTVDAVNGARQLSRQPESLKQAAIADRLIITKVDLVEPAALAALKAQLAAINPAALLFESANAPPSAEIVLGQDVFDLGHKSDEVHSWLAAEATNGSGHDDHPRRDVSRHEGGIVSFALAFDTPIEWAAFGLWLSMLVASHGENVLRVKGILRVAGAETPVVIQAVQHLVHPPTHLERWPDDDRRSRLVFIVRDLDPDTIRRSLAAFRRLGHRADAA
jgi:G3E family GTPase